MPAVAAKPATAALILRDWLDSENGILMKMTKVDMERTVPFLQQQFIANKRGCKYAIRRRVSRPVLHTMPLTACLGV